MEYEMQRSKEHQEDWLVEAVNDGDQVGRDRGEIYSVVFSGSLAEERAREYLDWKNSCPG